MKTLLTATAVLLIASSGLDAQDATQYQHRAASLLLNGEYSAACTELEQAAELYKAQKDWKPYFACLTQLTQAYLSTQALADAKRTAKKALWQSISILGRDNDEAARAAHQLAQVYAAASRFEDALHFHQVAMDIRTSLFGAAHPLVADSHCLLASTYQQQGAYPLAEQHLNTALSILQQAYSAKHAETAPVLSQLGQLYLAMGKDQSAFTFCEQAVQVLRSARATDPERFVDALVQLARLEKPEQQEALFTEALSIVNKQENPTGVTVTEVLIYAGHQSAAAGQIGEALNYFQSAAIASAGLPSAVSLHKKALILSADCAMAQGDLRKVHTIYQRLINTSSHEDLLLKGAEVALLAEQWASALQWAEQALQHTENKETYTAYLIQARALLESGQPQEAEALIQQLLHSTPSNLQAQAYLIAGEAALQQKNHQGAIQHLQSGLDQASGAESALKLKLHAKLGVAHAYLALQDRNTIHNLKKSNRHFNHYARLLNDLTITPITLENWQWLQINSPETYELTLHSCYLKHQMSQEDKWLQAAFQYMESFRLITVLTEKALHYPSNLEQHLRYLSLNRKPAEYDSLLKEWQKQQMSSALIPVSYHNFREILEQNDMQVLSYFEGTNHLFVLSLQAEGCFLLRQRWTEEEQAAIQSFNSLRGYRDLLHQGDRVSRWLLPGLAEAASTPRLLFLPSHSLQFFSFAGLPQSGKLIGEQYELYSNTSATTFTSQIQTDRSWADPSSAIVELKANEQAATAGAVALPTKQYSSRTCSALLSEWGQQQGSTLLSSQQWAMSSLKSIGVLLLPTCSVDSLLLYAPKTGVAIQQLLLPIPTSDKHGRSTLDHAFAKWQQQGATQITCYPEDCQTPPTYMLDALTTWQSTGDMAKAMLDARQETKALLGETGELPAHWLQARLIGVPNETKDNVATNIPIRWILLTVILLIVIGWWVKR